MNFLKVVRIKRVFSKDTEWESLGAVDRQAGFITKLILIQGKLNFLLKFNARVVTARVSPVWFRRNPRGTRVIRDTCWPVTARVSANTSLKPLRHTVDRLPQGFRGFDSCETLAVHVSMTSHTSSTREWPRAARVSRESNPWHPCGNVSSTNATRRRYEMLRNPDRKCFGDNRSPTVAETLTVGVFSMSTCRRRQVAKTPTVMVRRRTDGRRNQTRRFCRLAAPSTIGSSSKPSWLDGLVENARLRSDGNFRRRTRRKSNFSCVVRNLKISVAQTVAVPSFCARENRRARITQKCARIHTHTTNLRTRGGAQNF